MNKYTNNELAILIEENRKASEYFHDNQNALLLEIKEQTTKTNGRVSKLEMWSFYIKGGIAVIVLLLVPVAIYIVTQTINSNGIHNQVQEAVEDALK